MDKDLLSVVVDEIKTNSAKFSVIATAGSVIVGVIVTVMVIKAVIMRKKNT